MPIIPSTAYNNPDIGGITKNLGVMLFGADALDPEARAKGRYYDATSAKARAEADLNTAKAVRERNANQYMGDMAQTIHDMRPGDPGEDAMNVRVRQDTARAHFNQAYAGDDPHAGQLAASGNLASIFIQSPDEGDKITGSLLQGKPVNYNEPTTPGAINRYAANDFAKTERTALASEYGSRQQAGATMYGANQQRAAADYRTDREHPAGIFEAKPNTDYWATTQNSPIRQLTGGGNVLHGQHTGADGTGPAVKSISPGESAAFERLALSGYPGLTKTDKKGNVIISPTLANSGLPAGALQMARSEGEKAYKASGSPSDYVTAYQRTLGKAPGTKYTATDDPWGWGDPYGTWAGGDVPASGSTQAPQQPATPASPFNTGAQQPAAGAAPAPVYMQGAPMVRSQQELPPLAQRTENMVINVEGAGAVQWSAVHGWLPVQHAAPTAARAAPPPPPQELPPPMKVNEVFGPSANAARPGEFTSPEQAKAVIAASSDQNRKNRAQEYLNATAVEDAAALPPTAQVFAPPPLPDLAHPIAPSAEAPQFNVQSPELAANDFASPTAVMVARQSRDPAVMARVAAYDAAQNAAQRGPQAPPAPPAMTFNDPGKARQVANDQSAKPADRRAAQAYLMQHQGGRR